MSWSGNVIVKKEREREREREEETKLLKFGFVK